MARPNKYNLQYFPLDVDFFDDHKILSVEEDFSVKGGYIAIRILTMVYKDKGYYLEWPDRFEVTVAKRVGNGITSALVGDVFKSCLKHGLFDRLLFDKHRIVTSVGIQKRWLEVMNGMRRKPVVNVQFWLISSEEKLITSEETTLSETLSTQKERKEKEIKEVNTLADDVPSPPPKKEKESTEERQALCKKRMIEFGKSLASFESQYTRAMLLAFYTYWKEPNKSQTKMKFELERTWDLKLRLIRWEKNQHQYRGSNGKGEVGSTDLLDGRKIFE